MYRNTFTSILILLVCCTGLLAQDGVVLGINDRFTDEELVEDIFLKGFCSNVSNVRATGTDFSIGNFFNGGEVIGMDDGIIISTGRIENATGPNESPSTGGFIGTFTDEDLSQVATAGIFDVSGLSFDFVPLSNRVSFTYVFASEEYCEYVGSVFNDVFGFFVSGPGISGSFSNNGINVAKVPATNDNVSINTINHLSNQGLYVRNELLVDSDFCGISFAQEEGLTIEFDGFTKPLRAEFDVIPCETYTIRLMISDVSDADWDSAVFLEMNSFDIGGNLSITALSETGQDTLVSEGCTDGLFRFERIDADLNFGATFDLKVTEGSTATLGEDVEDIDLQITFAPGERVIEMPINVIDDGIAEGTETFGLSIDGLCACIGGGRATLEINDASAFSANLDGYFACAGEEFTIEPEIIGGAPPYTYLWEDGSTSNTFTTTIEESTFLEVRVSDFCDRTTVARAEIDITSNPKASIGGDYTLCQGLDANIPVTFEGSPPWNLTYLINDINTIREIGIESQPFQIPASEAGDIKLVSFRDRTCEGVVEGVANISAAEIEIESFVTPATCSNNSDGTLGLDIVSDSPAAEIVWNPATINGTEGDGLLPGDYQLNLTDERGCQLNEIFTVGVDPDGTDCGDLNIYIPNVFSPNNDRQEDNFVIQLQHEPAIVNVASFSIFDRWGSRVFVKKNFPVTQNNLQFSGKLNDQELEPTVLSYVAVFNMIGGETRSVSGTITVVR